ncbi:MAG: caspase family protein [Methylobacterium sp.]|uniref:caspase family protein n=1 Tax=Methylobacterium sp. TaxID=409 RepID=UPI0025839FAE|nr:caspase family protein [Methylobacterium sp.]MBY0297359.1 caspase family protein [Methylobacterium sp.]
MSRTIMGWIAAAILAVEILGSQILGGQARAAECEPTRAAIAELRQGARVGVETAATHVGAPVTVRWSRSGPVPRAAVFLVVATDRPVRFSGQGLYGLTPGAEAAFRFQRFAGMTRAVIPLFGEGAARQGAFDVTILAPGAAVLHWDVVGHDGCRESAGPGAARTVAIQARPGGRPALVIGDPVDRGTPSDRFVSADGARLLEAHDGRYRLADAVNGAEIAERAGTAPRFSPTGRFVAAEEQDGIAVLDAVDGTRVFTLGGTDAVAWDNADSFIAGAGSQWGTLGVVNALNPGGPGYGGTHLGPRSGGGVDDGAYRIDLENNLAAFAGPLGVIIDSLTGANLYSGTLLDLDKVPAAREQAARIARAASGFRPFTLPKVWETRGPLVFTHLGLPAPEERSPAQKALARFLAAPRKAPPIRVLAETEAATATGMNRAAWRGLPAQAETGRTAVDRFARRLAEFGFAFLPVAAPERTVGRFESGYQKELPKPQALRVAASIAAEVPAARGTFEYLDGLSCEPEQPGRFNSNINVARRWTIGGRIVWLAWRGCTEGNAAFNRPNLYVFDSTRKRVAEFTDRNARRLLRNDAEVGAPSCAYTVDSCLDNAELHGDRYLVLTSREGQAFAVYDLQTEAVVAKRFDLSRGPQLRRILLTASRDHAVQINQDGTFFVYRLAGGAQVLAGRIVDDEVVAAAPDGRFDATAEGAEMVRLRFPGQRGEHALAQFAAQLRVPGLVASVLSGRPPRPAGSLAVPPSLAATLARAGDEVRLTARAEGSAPVRTIQVYEDGLLTRQEPYPASGGTIEARFAPLPGTRWVSLLAVDETGLASAPVGRDVGPGGRRRARVLAAGVDRYDDPRVPPLTMATRDAEAFAAALDSPATGLALAARPVLLRDHEASPDALRQALAAAIDAAAADETVILFFAGHGVRDEAGRLFLATSGLRTDAIAATALPWDDLVPILSRAKGRVAIFLDTCHSGAAGTGFLATNDASASAILTGMPSRIMIFSASKGREEARELASGGVFTRAIIDVITTERDRHDLNRNGVIELSELHRGVKARVWSATQGQQTPWFARSQMVGDVALF